MHLRVGHLLRYHLVVYYLNSFEQRRKAMRGLAVCASSLYNLLASMSAG